MSTRKHLHDDQFRMFDDAGNPTKEALSSISPEREKDLRSKLNMYGARIATHSRREDWEKAKELYPYYIAAHNELNPHDPIDVTHMQDLFG